MIKIWQKRKSGDITGRKAIEWLNSHGIEFDIVTPRTLERSDILNMVKVSELGFDSILTEVKKDGKFTYHKNDQNVLTFNQFIEIILENPSMLKTLIIYDERVLVGGWNLEEIRVFLPRNKRKLLK